VFTKENIENIPKTNPYNTIWQDEIIIDEDIISKYLESLNESKSPGPDGLHPYILKGLAKSLSRIPLNFIFKQSLEEGKLPSDWKCAAITAIFKKSDRKQQGNYRPVSLTSIVCKVMD